MNGDVPNHSIEAVITTEARAAFETPRSLVPGWSPMAEYLYCQRDEAPSGDFVERDMTTRDLHVRAETLDVPNRSIEAVMSTETRAIVYDWQRDELLEEILIARGMELPVQVPLLESHIRWSIEHQLGSVRSIRLENNTIVGRLFFASDDERADMVWNKVRQGHVTDVSIGYRVMESVRIPANTTETVDGRSHTAGELPLRISLRSILRENSVVPIGADQGAKMRAEFLRARKPADVGTNRQGSVTMTKELRQYLQSLGLRSDATEDAARAFYEALATPQRVIADLLTRSETAAAEPVPVGAGSERAADDSSRTSAGTGSADGGASPAGDNRADADVLPAQNVDVERIRREAYQVERTRIARMEELAGDDTPTELLGRAISEGWDAARASQEFLTALREGRAPAAPAGNGPGIHTGGGGGDRAGVEQAMSGGLMIRLGLDQVDTSLPEQVQAAQRQQFEAGSRYRSHSLPDLCREMLLAQGHRLDHNRSEMIRDAMSTGAMTAIFTTTFNAALMKAFIEAGDSTLGWCSERDVNDFKPNEEIQLSKMGALEKHSRGGEATHATREDSLETFRVARYSKKAELDDMDIIDDRLNALQSMPTQMGQSALRLRPDLVYALLLANADLADGTALFHADHGNLGTGGGSVLAASGIEAGLVAMAKQTQNFVQLNLEGKFLIVPQDLRFTGAVLLRSAQRIISANSDGTLNPLNELGINMRIDNRLGVAGVTDPDTKTAHVGTATNWFLAASPTQGPTVLVAYLAGSGRRPVMRAYPLTEGRWGIGWDVKMDIGAKALDHRGLYKSNGA